MRKLAALAAIFAFVAIASPAKAISLWDDEARSLIADNQARFVGDIVTVIVSEGTNASQRNTSEINQEDKMEVAPNTGLLQQIFEGTALDTKDEYSFDGTLRDQGSLTTRLSAQIVEVLPNGNLLIEAKRTMVVGPETRMFSLSGVIRRADISQNNTILSNQVANAIIRYDGEGPQAKREKPGILNRIFDLIF